MQDESEDQNVRWRNWPGVVSPGRVDPDRPPWSPEKITALRQRAHDALGKPVNWTCPRTIVAMMAETVNTCWRERISVEELADAIRTKNIKLPQIDTFLTETDTTAQRIFAREFGISEEQLLETAEAFAVWAPYRVPLLEEK